MLWMATNGQGGSIPRRRPMPGENVPADSATRHAEATAADWQIILHLRTLIEREPAIVMELLADARQQPISYTTTIYAATREAISDRPQEPRLHYYSAAAAAQLGRFREAEAALDEAIRLSPDYAEAHLLAARLALETRQTSRALQRLLQAEQIGANPTEVATLRARLQSLGSSTTGKAIHG